MALNRISGTDSCRFIVRRGPAISNAPRTLGRSHSFLYKGSLPCQEKQNSCNTAKWVSVPIGAAATSVFFALRFPVKRADLGSQVCLRHPAPRGGASEKSSHRRLFLFFFFSPVVFCLRTCDAFSSVDREVSQRDGFRFPRKMKTMGGLCPGSFPKGTVFCFFEKR